MAVDALVRDLAVYFSIIAHPFNKLLGSGMLRQRREYLRLLEKAIHAAAGGVDAYNRVHNPYRHEETLILTTNGWELLAKSILIKRKKSIEKDKHGNTISAEVALSRLCAEGTITSNQEDCMQQIASLRHAATHYLLPDVPNEIMQHLLFYSCKFFREVIEVQYPPYAKKLPNGYLSISFSNLTTYADKVQIIVSKMKRNESDKTLVWLLERGIKFDGSSYITKAQFSSQYSGKKKIMPHLEINGFIKGSDMVRLVPVEAPKNYTADITLRKGSSANSALPVIFKKTEMESDYPYLTNELGKLISKNQNFTAKMIGRLNLKGNPSFHQQIRSSKSGFIERYSEAALAKLKETLRANPGYNPYANP